MTGPYTNSHDTFLPFHFRNYLSYSRNLSTISNCLHVSGPEVIPATPVAHSFPIDPVLSLTSFTPQVYFPTDLSFESQLPEVIEALNVSSCNMNPTLIQCLYNTTDIPPQLGSSSIPDFDSIISSNPISLKTPDFPVELNQVMNARCFTQPIEPHLLETNMNISVSALANSNSLASSSLSENVLSLPWGFDTPPGSEIPLSSSLFTSSQKRGTNPTETSVNEFTPHIVSNPTPEYPGYSTVTFTASTKLLDNSQLVYPCTHPACKKTFTSISTLKSHYRIHSPERPFHCHICYKYFNTAHDLRRHLKTHMDLKPYRCNKCSRCFGRLDAMKRHRSNCRCAISKMVSNARNNSNSSTTNSDQTAQK